MASPQAPPRWKKAAAPKALKLEAEQPAGRKSRRAHQPEALDWRSQPFVPDDRLPALQPPPLDAHGELHDQAHGGRVPRRVHLRSTQRYRPPSQEQAQYVQRMRSRFTDAHLLDERGQLLQIKFADASVTADKPRRLSTSELARFLQGLAQHGVGSWRQLQQTLPHMSHTELEGTTRWLLSSWELGCYTGWRPSSEQIMAERTRNLRIAEASGCIMPSPMLADTDNGDLEQWVREHPEDAQPGPEVVQQLAAAAAQAGAESMDVDDDA